VTFGLEESSPHQNPVDGWPSQVGEEFLVVILNDPEEPVRPHVGIVPQLRNFVLYPLRRPVVHAIPGRSDLVSCPSRLLDRSR